MSKDSVYTENAPAPFQGAPYSQAIKANGLVFVSGQVGLDHTTGSVVEGGVQAETHKTFDNMAAILEAAGSGLDRVVRANVYLADLGDFGAMNEVYAARMPAPFPARAAFQVAKLPAGALVEIEVIALQ
jgi:2-iminobutanoate/2-iminopropanoate deaminase